MVILQTNLDINIKIFNLQRIMNDKVNTVVIGKLIKEELQRQGKTSVWLANELGCHRTNIYKVYDRTTIDTGMLFHISKILKVDFFKYYSDALSSKRKK